MPTHKGVFTAASQQDLFDIYSYLVVTSSVQNADKQIASLRDACHALRSLPNRGHVPQEFELLNVSDYLEIHRDEYRIIYEVIEKVVYIYCIVHMKRDAFDLLMDRLLS